MASSTLFIKVGMNLIDTKWVGIAYMRGMKAFFKLFLPIIHQAMKKLYWMYHKNLHDIGVTSTVLWIEHQSNKKGWYVKKPTQIPSQAWQSQLRISYHPDEYGQRH